MVSLMGVIFGTSLKPEAGDSLCQCSSALEAEYRLMLTESGLKSNYEMKPPSVTYI